MRLEVEVLKGGVEIVADSHLISSPPHSYFVASAWRQRVRLGSPYGEGNEITNYYLLVPLE